MIFNRKATVGMSWNYIIALVIGGLVVSLLIWWWANDLGLSDMLKGFSNVFK
jgi:hypothetical protein